jgi:hypothetical protein
MARIGSNIQAGLGRIDYSPLFQGMSNAQQFAAQGNAALAQSITNIGQTLGVGIQSYFKDKQDDKLLDSSVNDIFASAKQKKSVSDYINSRVPESATEDEKKTAFRQSLINIAGGDKRAAAAFGYKTIEQLNAQEADQKRQASIAKSLQGAFDSGIDPLSTAINAGLPIDQALSISNVFANRQNMTAAQRKAADDAARQAERDRRQAEIDAANIAKTQAETALLNRRLGTQEDTRPAPPAGFEYASPDFRNTTMRPIPGGPAAIAAEEKMTAKEEKQRALDERVRAQQIKLDATLGNIDQAIRLSRGGAGGPFEGIPFVNQATRVASVGMAGSKTSNLSSLIESINAGVAIDEIEALKAQSPTGSTGFGNLTEGERQALSSVIVQLKPDLPERELQDRLIKLRDTLMKLRGNRSANPQTAESIAPESEDDAALANRFLGRNRGFRSTTR